MGDRILLAEAKRFMGAGGMGVAIGSIDRISREFGMRGQRIGDGDNEDLPVDALAQASANSSVRFLRRELPGDLNSSEPDRRMAR